MKKLLFSLFLIASVALTAQDQQTTARVPADFERLQEGLTQVQIIEQFGNPDEFRGNDYFQYIYDLENNQYVVLKFNTSTLLLNDVSVWDRRFENRPKVDFTRPNLGRAIKMAKPEVPQKVIASQDPSTETPPTQGNSSENL